MNAVNLKKGSHYVIIDEKINTGWGYQSTHSWCISDYWRTEFPVDVLKNRIIVFERRKSLTYRRMYLYVQEKDLQDVTT